MNRNDSQGLAIVARPDKSLNRHFVATSQLAPPRSAVGTADTSSNSALGNKWSSYTKSEGLRDVFQGKIHPRLPTRNGTVGGVVNFSQVLKFIYSFSPGILEFAAHISTLR